MSSALPLVCICIPTYNAEQTIGETLRSILAQSYANLVVHVSDNASTDDTLKVVESLADSRVTIHRFVENIGGEGNFNRCIELAVGEYTAIFHADDIYEADMVAKQVAFLEGHPEAGAVFAGASLIDGAGRKFGEAGLPKGLVSTEGLYDFETMFKAVLRYSNFFICSSVMVRTRVYQNEIKCWRGELFKSSADLDLWFRILQHHPVGYLKDKLMRYRISSQQFSARVRLRTERADFFLVTDHYLAQQPVRALLGATDMKNYMRLERADRVIRAINLFLTGYPRQARELVHDAVNWDVFAAAYQGKRARLALFGGLYIKLMVALGLHKIGKAALVYLKQVFRK
jgi:glycosyltransferase involved in cell wall biosynthesis